MEDKAKVTQIDIKDAIKKIKLKCAADPIYFMKVYCMIQHPQKSRVKFDTYEFQDKVLSLILKKDYLIINKSRQLGISTLVAMYILWLMTFHQDKNIVIVATKQETAKNMVTKIGFAYDNLPSYLKEETESYNKLSIRFKNGSQVKAVSKAGDAGRSEAASLLVLDEAAFIDNVGTIFTAAQQTLATGGKCIAISTPNGTGENWFYQEFTKAEHGKNKFTAVRLPWTVHPERDQAWRDEQDKILGSREASQECDANFLTSGATVIDPEILTYYEQFITSPMEKRGMGGSYWLWEFPDFTKTYAIIADTSRGDGADYSTFIVLDVEKCEVVAEFKDQVDTRTFGNLLVNVAHEWNDGLLVIENTGVGWDVVQTAIQRQYPNLYYSPRSSEANASADLYLKKFSREEGMVPGFTNSNFTRPLVISKLVTLLQDKTCMFKSKRMMDELRTFIWKNGKAQAQHGSNDDLVMPLGIGLFLRDTALVFRSAGDDLTKAVLNNMRKSDDIPLLYTPGEPLENNPWMTKNIWGQDEDLTWLLK